MYSMCTAVCKVRKKKLDIWNVEMNCSVARHVSNSVICIHL